LKSENEFSNQLENTSWLMALITQELVETCKQILSEMCLFSYGTSQFTNNEEKPDRYHAG